MNRFEIKEKYQYDNVGGYIAEVNGRSVGHARYNGCEITQMEVDLMFQGIGIGTALLKSCEQKLRKKGCLRSLVYSGPTSPHQPNPRGFYHKNGYSGWNHLEKDLQ
jgi:GNAT superfamily N-acetyltransferase